MTDQIQRKLSFADPATKRTITAAKPTAPVATASAPVTPTPAPQPAPATTPSSAAVIADLINQISKLPEQISIAQEAFDNAQRRWASRKVSLVIAAFSTPLFPGKKPEDGLRPASNEAEREAAVESLCLNDADFADYSDAREGALRALRYAQNEFDALKLIVTLLTSKN